jgi:hypothetical protein
VKKKFVFAEKDYTEESPEAAESPDKKAMKETTVTEDTGVNKESAGDGLLTSNSSETRP